MAEGPSNPLDHLLHRFAADHDRPAIVALDDRVFTYGALWWSGANISRQWAEAGVKPGETVAFMLPNSAAMPCCYLACLIGGFVACPIVPTSTEAFVDDVVALVKPSLVVRETPHIDPARTEVAPTLDRDPDAPFLIMFTSGLTGKPKAMLHGARGVFGSARAFAGLTGLDESSRMYHVLPMAYMAGLLNAFLAPVMAGATIVEGPGFSPEMAMDFWTRPLAHGVNTWSITPTIAAALARLTRSAETRERVRTVTRQVQCTSAVIPVSVRARFLKAFGHPLQDCFGMTELGGPLTCQTRGDALAGVRHTTPLEEITVDLREDEPGDGFQLWIRSPYSMLGYLSDDGLHSPFDDEGFLDTGDLAELDEGRIGITGRRKDLIIRGGINISPVRVESVLGSVPGLDEIVVIGVDHEFWGEVIVACLVLEAGANAAVVDAVRERARVDLGVHERPDRFEVVDSIPRSFIGKIQKDVLRARVSAGA